MHYSDDRDFTSRVNFSLLLQTNLCKCSLRQGQEVRQIRRYFGVLMLGKGNELVPHLLGGDPGPACLLGHGRDKVALPGDETGPK